MQNVGVNTKRKMFAYVGMGLHHQSFLAGGMTMEINILNCMWDFMSNHVAVELLFSVGRKNQYQRSEHAAICLEI